MFYTKLQKICNEKNIKIYTMIRELKLSNCIIERWKKGSTPNVYNIYDIAKYLNVRIEDLIDRDYL